MGWGDHLVMALLMHLIEKTTINFIWEWSGELGGKISSN
jgi:hypothetical protein